MRSNAPSSVSNRAVDESLALTALPVELSNLGLAPLLSCLPELPLVGVETDAMTALAATVTARGHLAVAADLDGPSIGRDLTGVLVAEDTLMVVGRDASCGSQSARRNR